MSLRLARGWRSLLSTFSSLAIATTLYAGCGLDLDGTAGVIDNDAAADDVYAPPPDGNADAQGDAAPRTCSDGFQDGDESDVDCGGMTCPARCGIGKRCGVNGDCSTVHCDAMTKLCAAPSCTDGAKNGSETDVDCGGSCTTKCADGKGCAVGADCVDGVCTGGKCAAPTCTDMVKNGSETDVDCGGGTCATCAVQKACKVNGDCMSGHCQANVCVAAACTDGIKDGSETDVDCGGPQCGPCADNKACALPSDCTSHVCTAMLCKAPTCTDGVKNGTETDVDCGGGACTACAATKACRVGADCASGVCNANVCQAPSCSDGVKNGTETDVDCGGSCANKCQYTQGCALNADCRGGLCSAMHCAATCTDGVKDGTETDVDCGGSCAACADGKLCLVQSDCGAASYCNTTTLHCAPKEALGTACAQGFQCGSGNCVDGTCCNVPQSSCNGCRACNLGGGMCANVPAGQDPHNACMASVANCKGAACAGDGTCNVPDSTSCGASSCAVATQTNHVCVGGACTNPTVACTPYVCGASACAAMCSSDLGCASGFYCDQNGACQAQKAQGATCNTTTECRVAGCRECGSAGGCVDGYCCNSACGSSCQACSTALGAATNGACGTVSAGSPGRGPSCSPLLCDGSSATCPASCASDSQCVAGTYCSNTGMCLAQKTLGAACDTTADCKVAGCRECTVACVAGLCT